MPAAKNRRWIWAVLFVVLFPLFATHFSCIAVLGPGTWGSGLDERLPTIMPANSNPRVAGYVKEFAYRARKAASQVEAPPGASPFPGRAVYSDSIAPGNLWVVQTHEGERWIDEQRVFVLRGGGAERQEVRIPEAMLVENPVFLRRGGRVVLVFGRWHSWHLSMGGKLARYWDSLFDETLRPEYSLYLYDLDEKQSTYWGPGHTLVASPDRRRALLLRSGALGGSYYSLHLWDFDTDELETIVSLRESDPGSGRSFDYRWAKDSRAFQLTGRTGGFVRRQREGRDLNLIYLVGNPNLYEVTE